MGDIIQAVKELLELKKNVILQGAPGVGKTYEARRIALSIVDNNFSNFDDSDTVNEAYQKYIDNGQIEFVTFHQSMDYEDFVEGIKTQVTDSGAISYNVESGIFKRICERARVPQSQSDDTELIQNIDKTQVIDILKDLQKQAPFSTMSDNPDSPPYEYFIKINGNNVDLFIKRVWCESLEIDTLVELVNDNTTYPLICDMANTYHGKSNDARWVYYYDLRKRIRDILQSNKNTLPLNYVLIIDEINRANLSKVFGELITLLESDKRQGGDSPLTLTLPYSTKKFSVPSNLYIIGTINTTDRSTGNIDYAIRRRFAFYTLESEKAVIINYSGYDSDGTKQKAESLFDAVYNFINSNKSDMDISDLMVGHSYFLGEDIDKLRLKLDYEIIPLIKEYIKDGILLCENDIFNKEVENWKETLNQ